MPLDAAGNWSPGPNDHHIKVVGEGANARPVVEAGLGKDEPDFKAVQRMKAGEAKLAALREKIAAASKELDSREADLQGRERLAAIRERKLLAKLAKAGITEKDLDDASTDAGGEPAESDPDDAEV